MSPEERTNIIERINRQKFSQHYAERSLFMHLVRQYPPQSLDPHKIRLLQRKIRADHQRYLYCKDDGYDDFDGTWMRGPYGKESLIYYGSDSYEDIEDFGDVDG